MRKPITYLLILLGSLSHLNAQDRKEKGVPYLRNIAPAEYDKKGKIWDIESASNGIIYMVSDNGMIEFDGMNWNYFTGSAGVTRSVIVANDSVIYTGSDRDFGVWYRNEYNDFEYSSLYPFREDLNTINEEFWGLHQIDDITFFISSDNIYAYRNGSLTKIPAPAKIEDSYDAEESLYFLSEDDQLYRLDALSPVPVMKPRELSGLEVTGIYIEDGALHLIAKNAGIYKLSGGELNEVDSPVSRVLKNSNVFSFQRIGDTQFAFGTVLKGLYISDADGRIIHHINKNKGLQNNTILSMHYGPSGKLWMGMDYGLSFIDLEDEFSYFYDLSGDFGTGYTAILQDGQFYLGTNQGLYRAAWEDLDNSTDLDQFKLIPGSEGQVWTLEIIDDQLWMGHDRGLFRLEGGRLTEISSRSGFWNVQKYRDHIIAGSYNGISIFEEQEGNWEYLRQMELILGSCNQVLIEGADTLWVNIPNYGVIRARLDAELYPQERQIFQSEEFEGGDHILKFENNELVVNTELSQYNYISEDKSIQKNDREVTTKRINDFKIPNVPTVLLNEDYEFYPIYNGFALKDLRSDRSDQVREFDLLIRKIEAFNAHDTYEIMNGAEVPHRFNNLRMRAAIPGSDQVQYQFSSGNPSDWSEWSESALYELPDMDYGKHEIKVRAKINDTIVREATLNVTIITPWYMSPYAYFVYAGLILGVFYVLYKWQNIILDRQKQDLLAEQKRSLNLQNEKHREQLQRLREEKLISKNDKLKDRLKSKTIELANKAKENEEKNSVLKELKNKLEKVESNPGSLKSIINEMDQILNSYLNLDDNTFEIQIDELHQKFFETLRSKYPDLTLYDLRLCAYLKLGFDTKEISNLLNIKPSSVYISRSRLRKKLDMENDEDLHTYLNSLKD